MGNDPSLDGSELAFIGGHCLIINTIDGVATGTDNKTSYPKYVRI